MSTVISRGARVLGQIRTGREDNVRRLATDTTRCDLHLRDTVTCSQTTETGSSVWIEIAACGPTRAQLAMTNSRVSTVTPQSGGTSPSRGSVVSQSSRRRDLVIIDGSLYHIWATDDMNSDRQAQFAYCLRLSDTINYRDHTHGIVKAYRVVGYRCCVGNVVKALLVSSKAMAEGLKPMPVAGPTIDEAQLDQSQTDLDEDDCGSGRGDKLAAQSV